MHNRKAMIAMSGGVDSSVAAHLMQEAGYECAGAMMRLYDHPVTENTPADSAADARAVADKLSIPFYLLDARAEFDSHVIQNFIGCYECGTTPNPCIQCNRHLKFDHFLRQAELLGYDTIVTGHYARVRYDETLGLSAAIAAN